MRTIALVFAIFALCAVHCGTPVPMGGGSDTEVCGLIIFSHGGGVASNTVVKLIPAQYNPAFDSPLGVGGIDTTDASGWYHFNKIPKGIYNVEAYNLTKGSRLLRTGVVVDSGDSIVVPVDSVRCTAGLVVALPNEIAAKQGAIYIKGTTYFARKNSGARSVAIDSIPRCLLPAIEFKSDATDSPLLLYQNISSDTGSIIRLMPYSAWLHSAKLMFNIRVRGSCPDSNIVNFPLFLRLDSSNFDFTKALPDGADLRFTDKNGGALPYEIAKWNSASRQAAVWIATDTIFAQGDSQFVRMYWGNPAALNMSNGKVVFDTARGFAAMWHLEEEQGGVGTPGLYKDATTNANNGDDSVSATDQTGFVGNGHVFAGTDNIPTHRPVAELGTADFTICAWIKSTAAGGVVLSKGNGGTVAPIGYKEFSFCDTTDTLGPGLRPTFKCVGGGYLRAERDIGLDQWHFLTVRLANKSSTGLSSTFFIDGGLCGTTSTIVPGIADYPAGTMTIGSGNGRFFTGSLDELNFSKVCRSDDWIMLAFENQRPGQGFVTVVAEK
jgi:hypothetical protein